MIMVDIHTHILPGVDDGAMNMPHAIAMARLAASEGTSHLFATPHHDFVKLSRLEVAKKVAVLQEKLDAAKIPLTILPGYEIHLHDNIFDDWERQIAGPLGASRYVLVEPSFYHYDQRTNEILFEFFDRGFVPVLAHPERIIPIQKDLTLIEPMLARGGLTQVTTNSLLGRGDASARRTAEAMLRQGKVHIIASDAHNTSYRSPGLIAGRDAAAKIVGVEAATAMVTTNPMAIVNNEPLPS